YIKVDIYGKCGTRICPRNCLEFLGVRYKFYLAFENADCQDYVTEKVWRNSFKFNMVPIVRGRRNNFKNILPPYSYIHTNKFDSHEELAQYLKYLDNNDDEYNKYFEWRKTFISFNSAQFPYYCSLCRQLHMNKGQKKWYNDIWKWYSIEKQCNDYTSMIPENIND
ncbi:unnamed protein product, partial [Owenia fusiformis]